MLLNRYCPIFVFFDFDSFISVSGLGALIRSVEIFWSKQIRLIDDEVLILFDQNDFKLSFKLIWLYGTLVYNLKIKNKFFQKMNGI